MADVISLASVRADQPKYPWLTPLVVSLDSITATELRPVADKDPMFDPYQVEDHLEEITRLLDNCLAYRREIQDLQSLATKSALDYELFTKQVSSAKQLEIAKGVKDQLEAVRPHYNNAATGFAEAGEKALATASFVGAEKGIIWEEQRARLIQEKWDLVEQYQSALSARHSEKGNSLNYVDRFNRVLDFYKEDIKQAYALARAVVAGIRIITTDNLTSVDLKADLPDLSDDNYLDKLVFWCRSLARRMNYFHSHDAQSEITIPLRNLSALKTNFSDQMKDGGAGELIFDLSSYFPPGMRCLRLKGVALSYGAANPAEASLRYMQVAGLVVPPSTLDPFGAAPNDKTVPRHPLLVEAVLGDKMVPPRYVTSPNFNNISPKGQWTVLVSKKVTKSDEKDRPARTEALIQNINLHLLLASQTTLSNDGFKDFSI